MSTVAREQRADLRPELGAIVPSWALRAVFAAVGVATAWIQLVSPAWIIVGVVVALVSALLPRLLFGWILILLLGASVFWQGAPDWRFSVLLIGVHLLHLLGAQLLVLPWRSGLQARALAPLLRRFLLVQAPAQAGCWLILVLSGAHTGEAAIPALGFVAAAALLALVLVLVVPLLREKLRLH